MRRLLAIAGAVAIVAGLLVSGQRSADRPIGPDRIPDPAGLPDRGELRLAVLGTSLTAATPWAEAAERLSECLGRPVSIVAIAGAGETSLWGVRQVPRVLEARPDLLLVEFTINDADLRRGVLPGASVTAHRDIVASVRAARPGTQIALLRLNRAHGLRGLLRPALGYYERTVAGAMESLGVGLVDLRAYWSSEALGNDLWRDLPDGLHPTAEAAASVTVPAFVSVLASAVAPDRAARMPACARSRAASPAHD